MRKFCVTACGLRPVHLGVLVRYAVHAATRQEFILHLFKTHAETQNLRTLITKFKYTSTFKLINSSTFIRELMLSHRKKS